VSAQPTEPTAGRALAAGAHPFVTKPFEAEHLLGVLREALGK
jgi:CheY-like chemotaxis protein